MATWLRLLGKILPSVYGIDYRIIGRFHRKKRGFSESPILCGNGFLMVGHTSNASYVSGINERQVLKALSSIIKPGEVVYNIGANAGYTALWLALNAAARGGAISVVAFEPEPENFALLSENVSLNPDLDISCEKLAIGDLDGVVRMSSNGRGDGAAHISKDGGFEVDIVTLDSFLERTGSAPDWIFMDVEGFGGACMKGAHSLLERHQPKIAYEVHSAEEEKSAREVLEAHGYERFVSQSSIWGRFDFWQPVRG